MLSCSTDYLVSAVKAIPRKVIDGRRVPTKLQLAVLKILAAVPPGTRLATGDLRLRLRLTEVSDHPERIKTLVRQGYLRSDREPPFTWLSLGPMSDWLKEQGLLDE